MRELFPFQETGARWLAADDVKWPCRLLGDDMGLGKTAQASLAFVYLRTPLRVFVIVPAIGRPNWQREFADWTGGSRMEVLEKLSDPVPAFGHCVFSFEYATENFEAIKAAGAGGILIVDEAHFLSISNEDQISQRSVAVLGQNGLARSFRYVWALTGTPVRNHAGNIWPWLSFAGLTTLTYGQWVKRYCTGKMDGRRFVVKGTKTEMLPEIRSMLRDSGFMLRRMKKDVFEELPPVIYGEITVDPQFAPVTENDLITQFPSYFVGTGCNPAKGIDQRDKLWEKLRLERELATHALGDPSIFTENDFYRLQALANAVPTLIRYIGLLKARPVIEIIKGWLEADPLMKVFCIGRHKGPIEALREGLRKYGAVSLYGKTKPARRDQNVKAFQNYRSTRVIIGHVVAAGINITLTEAHRIVVLECPWVPTELQQAIDRVRRIGLQHIVNCDYISLADDPIDRAMVSNLRRKSEQIAAMVDLPVEEKVSTIRVEDLL